jgi:hypothetical protein
MKTLFLEAANDDAELALCPCGCGQLTETAPSIVVRREVEDRDEFFRVALSRDGAGVRAVTMTGEGVPPGVEVELRDHELRAAEAVLDGRLA